MDLEMIKGVVGVEDGAVSLVALRCEDESLPGSRAAVAEQIPHATAASQNRGSAGDPGHHAPPSPAQRRRIRDVVSWGWLVREPKGLAGLNVKITRPPRNVATMRRAGLSTATYPT